MAWNAGCTEERDVKTMSMRAGAAINPYRILMADTDADEVIQATSGLYWPAGVSGDGSENNKGTYAEEDYVNMKYDGIVKVSMSGTGSRYDRVIATTAGQGLKHETVVEGVWVFGIAMQDWTADQVIPVLVERQLIASTESITSAI